MGMKKYNKSKKNILKNKQKSKKYKKKGGHFCNYPGCQNKLKKSGFCFHHTGGSRCTINIPQNTKTIVNTNNCNIGGTDCFNNPESLPQLGILPTTPNLSEVAFDGRYCCGVGNAGSQNGGGNQILKDGMISSKNILGSNKNVNFYVSNGRFSTEGITKKEAQNIKNILKKKKKLTLK